VALVPPVEGRESWRAKLGLQDSDVVACMIANLHGNKDHDTLLRAWRLVLDQVPSNLRPPHLLLAGRLDGAALRLKALAFDLNLGITVRFLGVVNDISGLLSAVDLGVFSSRREGCPNGILECMAAGLPVVATNILGSRDALGDDARWLAEPGDYTGLGQNIVALLNRPDLRAADAKRNQQRIREVFSADRMCRETVAVIQKVGSPPTA
jgi:glycosyltransferase involved in cell wall biosynthesis